VRTTSHSAPNIHLTRPTLLARADEVIEQLPALMHHPPALR
jgi:hypothetical protein